MRGSPLAAGRLDRAAARTLFGDRLEAKWAPLVLLPFILAAAVIEFDLLGLAALTCFDPPSFALIRLGIYIYIYIYI